MVDEPETAARNPGSEDNNDNSIPTANQQQQPMEQETMNDDTADPIVSILVDARNGFNELNCGAMLWTAQHLWPKGATFAFNCYK